MNTEWKLVPVVPTWEMLSASGCTDHHQGQHCLHHENRKRIWAAMLGAAPEPMQAWARPVATVRGRMEPQGICYDLTRQTVSLKDGEEVNLYAWPTAAEELAAVLRWRGLYTTAIKERNCLTLAVADHFRVDLGNDAPWETALQVLDGDFVTQSDADRECDRLRAQLADLVTLGFNMVGSSGAKRKYHTELLTSRLHELKDAVAPVAGAAVEGAR